MLSIGVIDTHVSTACGIAAGSFGYKLHIKLHTGVKASVNHACQTETDDNKLRANAASGLKKKYGATY